MANSALPDEVAKFVADESKLYKEQIAGDAEATIGGCFMPPEMMEQAVVVARMCELHRLFQELQARDSKRIFFVCEQSLYASLSGMTNEQLEELKTVADYFDLPKSLVEAADLELAVVEARRQYHIANEGYNSTTATTPKPRLFDFLCKNDSLREILRLVLDQKEADRCSIIPAGTVSRQCTHRVYPHSHHQSMLRKGLLDGELGEQLSECGFAPSTARRSAYASGCILAGRPIPDGAIPQVVKVCEESEDKWDLIELSLFPLTVAAQVGNTAALEQFRDAGLDIATAVPQLMDTAAASGAQATLTWLQTTYAEAFKGHVSSAVSWALLKGHTATAKRLLDDSALELRATTYVASVHSVWWFSVAAERNDLATLKWLHLELGISLAGLSIPAYACQTGNKEMLDWYLSKLTPAEAGRLLDNHNMFFWEDLAAALRCGSMEVSRLIAREEFRPLESCCDNLLASACEGFRGDTSALDTLGLIEPPLLLSPPLFSVDAEYEALTETAAKLGYPQVFEWITRQPGKEDWFLDPKGRVYRAALHEAVESAQLECVRWLLNRATKDRLAQTVADNGGRRPGPLNQFCTLDRAAPITRALLDLLEPFYDLTCFYNAAVRTADVDLVRCLNGRGYKLRILTLEETHARLSDDGDETDGVPVCLVFEKLRDPHIPRPKALSFVRCLADECGVDFGEWSDICCYAVCDESLELMQLLVEKGAKLSPSVLAEAARWGHLPMCRWLRQQGVEWPTGGCEWLRERGVKWPGSISKLARAEGADEVAAWIEQEQAKEAGGAAGGAGAGHA